MPYSKSVFDAASRKFEAQKTENKLANERRHAEVCGVIPEYGKLEAALAQTMTDAIGAITEKKADSKEIIRAAMEKNQEIQRQMERVLMAGDFPADYLSKIYFCEKCKDIGSVDGQWCDCYLKLLKLAAAEEFNQSSMLRLTSFEDFDLSLYPADKTAFGMSCREMMTQNFEKCKSFAENFGSGAEKGLLIIGPTGLGKTHLSLAIANEVIKKGYSVMYNSAPEILSTLEKESFGRSDTDLMPPLTSCDLLILDDLGTEYKSERFMMFLYEIINTRLTRTLPTIVSTNLSTDELDSNYPDRIFSRLVSMDVLIFCGDDIRFKK